METGKADKLEIPMLLKKLTLPSSLPPSLPPSLGTSWLETILERMETGKADKREIPMLEEITRQIEGHTICALGDAAAWPVQVGKEGGRERGREGGREDGRE